MRKILSILSLVSSLNLFGQSPTPVANKPSNKYTLQIDAGINYFRYSSFGMTRRGYPLTESHYEAITVDRQLNPNFSISMGLRNTNYGYKRITDIFDINGNQIGNNITQQWNYWTIQTPIQIKYRPFQSKRISLNAGGYLGYNYFNSESSSSPVIKTKHDNDKNPLDIGMNVGMDFNWYKKGDFTLGNSVTYYRGFTYLSYFSTIRAQGLTIGCTAKWGF
jgi:Outer membrane protein beta-barrel domain